MNLVFADAFYFVTSSPGSIVAINIMRESWLFHVISARAS
jgi:hypothetical protein